MQSAQEMVAELGMHVDDARGLRNRLSDILVLMRGPRPEGVPSKPIDQAMPQPLLDRAARYRNDYREQATAIGELLNELDSIMNGEGIAGTDRVVGFR